MAEQASGSLDRCWHGWPLLLFRCVHMLRIGMSLNYPFLADQIARLVGPSAFVPDYGCGAGQIIEEAIARGHRAVGCDVALPMWENLAEGAKTRSLIYRIENGTVPFADD